MGGLLLLRYLDREVGRTCRRELPSRPVLGIDLYYISPCSSSMKESGASFQKRNGLPRLSGNCRYRYNPEGEDP